MKKFKRFLMITVLIIAALVAGVFIFLQQEQFGELPSGERLERIKKSPNYKDGKFQNQSATPDLTEGATYYSVLKQFIFGRDPRNQPVDVIPSRKTDLLSLSPDSNTLVWFGHSSYFMQLDGKKILVDPVLSGSASPVSFTTRSFKGSDAYTVEDLPEIDYLFISHDHWDHLDHETMKKLYPKVKKVICGLGVGAHFEHWGYETEKIVEQDWYDVVTLDSGFVVTFTPARHFSGRAFSRNVSLWTSFAFRTPSFNIYLGGDSGYDKHFKEIGEKYGPFDLAILECGQYDKSWKYIHMMPEEVVTAAKDLKAEKLLPVHWAKFSLGNHAWDDSILRVKKSCSDQAVYVITPLIGEAVQMDDSLEYAAWWDGLN